MLYQRCLIKKIRWQRRWEAWVAHVASATCSTHAGFNEQHQLESLDELHSACGFALAVV